MTLQKLLATTAIVALAAAPLAAFTVETDAALGKYEMIYPQVDPMDSTGPATGDGAASVAGSDVNVVPQADTDDSTGPATGDGVASTADNNDATAGVAEAAPEDSTGPATGDNAEATRLTSPAMAAGMKIDAESGFTGNSVVSSDGVVVGVVEEVVVQADGTKLLVVLRNGGTPDEGRFTLAVNGEAMADGQVDLGWTEAEFTAAVAAL